MIYYFDCARQTLQKKINNNDDNQIHTFMYFNNVF